MGSKKASLTDLNDAKSSKIFLLKLSKVKYSVLLGPNGAGKSTVINLLMGFIKADRGEIHIIDIPATFPQARKKVGYLPEDPRFYGNLNARELLRLRGAWPRV